VWVYQNELIAINPIKYGYKIVSTYQERIAPLVSKIKQGLIITGPDFKDDLKIAQIRKHAELEKRMSFR
jgi:hypothetical protein